MGRVLGRNFRPAGRAGPGPVFLCLWTGFGQAKNDFLVYFLAQPVLARKSPARNSGLWTQKFGPNLGPARPMGKIFWPRPGPWSPLIQCHQLTSHHDITYNNTTLSQNIHFLSKISLISITRLTCVNNLPTSNFKLPKSDYIQFTLFLLISNLIKSDQQK